MYYEKKKIILYYKFNFILIETINVTFNFYKM